MVPLHVQSLQNENELISLGLVGDHVRQRNGTESESFVCVFGAEGGSTSRQEKGTAQGDSGACLSRLISTKMMVFVILYSVKDHERK